MSTPPSPDTARAAGPSRTVTPARLVVAFASVYLIWGSTYLAIRFAIETLPPLLMAGARFLTAGAVLYAWGRSRGGPAPTLREWRGAAVVGGLLLVGGNGAVVVSEQWIPSGMAALVVASVPLWMVVIDTFWGDRKRPTGRVTLGLAAGFGGVLLLAGSPGAGAGGPLEFLGIGLLLAGSLSWAAGSIYARHAPRPARPRVYVGMQMLVGGALLVPAGALTGEFGHLDLGAVSLRSALALAYLVVFGAVIGYSAYIWLLDVVPAARAGTYAYVNPVVALFLGWWLADEPLTFRSMVAAAIIVGSVVIITTERSAAVRGVEPAAAPSRAGA
ncbi:MAG: EamA family transporter [Longimicrobiales bacterium]